jgi:hypothetical protein
MAEQESNEAVGVVDIVAAAVAGARSAVSRVWNAITKDGTLEAFVRQGADEMAMALRAFPESIHIDEPGTILNPTQGEITASRNPRLPSPSEIANSKQPYTPEHSQDNDHGMDR